MSETAYKEKKITYGDYLTWPDEERWELIDGEPYDMTPAPSIDHQTISMELGRQISTFLLGKECRVFAAPFDVRLPEGDEADEQIITVVQPDLAVICDPTKLDRRGCRGAPDFVIEIVSPATASKDQIRKAALYERHGVKEYWVVHPQDKLVTVRRREENGKFGIPVFYEGKGRLSVNILPGLSVDLDLAFQNL